MAFDKNEIEFLDECGELIEEKNKTVRELKEYIKTMAENLCVDREALRKYKDYWHFYGNGWGCREDGTEDPLLLSKDVKKNRDKISPCFRKLLDIVTVCSIFGDYKMLEPYIKSLSDYGINITINIPEKEHKSEYDDFIASAEEYQSVLCEIFKDLREEKKPEADLKNIVSKTNFNTATAAYNKLKHDRNIKDSLDRMALKSIVDQNFVTNTINYFGYEPAD